MTLQTYDIPTVPIHLSPKPGIALCASTAGFTLRSPDSFHWNLVTRKDEISAVITVHFLCSQCSEQAYRSQFRSPVVWMPFWDVIILLPLTMGWTLAREAEKIGLVCPRCMWWSPALRTHHTVNHTAFQVSEVLKIVKVLDFLFSAENDSF